MSEESIIRHCSPTLAGLKTANLFTTDYVSKSEVIKLAGDLNKRLREKGLRIIPLKYEKGRVLVYVYRPSKLKDDLKDHQAMDLLKSCGYSLQSPDQCLVRLVNRLKHYEEFPHEIGLFLGYPPEDVKGFMEHRKDYKCVGYWKVYGNEELARKKFAQYRKCSDVYEKQWMGGNTIERLTVAG